MPTLFVIEPKNKNQLPQLKQAAQLIGDNIHLSKLLEKCGCQIIHQSDFGRVVIHVANIYLFDS